VRMEPRVADMYFLHTTL